MAEQAASAPAATPAPTSNPRDFLGKAESALNDLHSGKLEGLELAETDGDSELPEGTEDADLPEEPAEEPEDGEDLEGSEASPYSIKTLPDKFVTIKVDGEERTVPLREMVDGYMRETAFHKRVNEVSELKKQAETVIERAKEERTKIQSSFRELLANPEDLYSFLDDHAEETLDKVARMRLQRMMEWQKNPQAKYEYERNKQQARLQKEQERLQREREEWTRTRTQTEQTEKLRKSFEPGWVAGMKEAGYPKVTDEFRVTVRGILNAIRETQGREWTAEDVKTAVIRAARITKAESVQERKPVPPKAPPPGQKRPTASAAAPAKPKSFRDVFRDLGK